MAFALPLSVAVTVTVVSAVTGFNVSTAVPDLLPDGMVTLVAANFAAAAGLTKRATLAPAAPAGPVRVTVIVDLSTPPSPVEMLDVTVATPGGNSLIVAVLLTVPSFAVTTRLFAASIFFSSTLKVPVLVPTGTITMAGVTVAYWLLETEIETIAPDPPACPVSVICPVTVSPEWPDVASTVMEAKTAGVTVRVPDFGAPPVLAEM